MASQAWYNSNWPFRAPITVANTLGSLTDYQVKVTLGSSGPWSSARNDGSDLLFTAADGITEIPYWIESWNYGVSAVIWVKVPAIAATPAQTTVFLYYGAPSVTSSEAIATPPIGPFTKDPGNPGVINGTGAPAADASLLPENIVYDPVTRHYWMVLSDQTIGSRVALVYSDDPTNPDAWYWSGYVINSAIAPHLMEHNGTWYIFYGDRSVASPFPISVSTATSVSGPYTKVEAVLPAGASDTWEDARADEPYVFQRNDGKWVMIYMGDAGGNVEQVGYATADNITGPYTKYAGNPCLPFGPAGSYDAGTVADPWVYEFAGVYYIGYTVSPTTSSPWQTALATTEDWTTFNKHGLLLERGLENNSFRGAVSRIGDEYVFSYTGGTVGYKMCIATQPVYTTQQFVSGGSNGDATFDFFDGFDGTSFDITKWTRPNGTAAQVSVGGGFLTLTGYPSGAYVRIDGRTSFGLGYAGETRGRHPNQGTNNLIAETGFASAGSFTNHLRILDDYPNTTYWQRQTASSATGTDAVITPMLQTSDKEWHIFHVYRENATVGRFQIDNTAPEADYTNIPSASIPPFLMSYSNVTATNNIFTVDWTRVRKYTGPDPLTTVGTVEFNGTQWIGNTSQYWNDPLNWTGGVPDASKNVVINTGGTWQPFIEAAAFCKSIIIGTGASLQIGGTTTLTVSGDWTNNGTFQASGAVTLVFNGETQRIGGSAWNSFNNLIINSTVSATLNGVTGFGVELYGDLTMASGTFDLGGLTVNNTQPGGTLTLSNGATLRIGGTGTLPSGYETHGIGSTSTIEYYGTNQDVAETTYGNLVLSGSGIKTFTASRAVSGNLTIKDAVQASLAPGTNSTANTLILPTGGQEGGTWGSTTAIPAPVHMNDTYFTSTGILTVGSSFTAGNWIGGTSEDWNTGSNWYGGAVPGSGTDVIIPDFAAFNPAISGLATPALCNTLTLNTGSALTINAGQALTVSGNVTNNGSIIIESAWVNSSGSLIAGSVSVTGTVTYKRDLRSDSDFGDKHLFSSPVGNQSVADFLTAYDAKIDQIRTWDELAGTWVSLSSGNFESGRGYNLIQAQNSDGQFSFTGSLAAATSVPGTSPYSLSFEARVLAYPSDPYGATDHNLPIWASPRNWNDYGAGGWNLLGNPFTSAMDAVAFITLNTTTTNRFDPAYQALYLYDGKSGYYKFAAFPVPGYVEGGSYGSYIQAGQGFFVLANNNGVQFDFSASMQVHNTVLPLLKSAVAEEPWPGLQLKVKYGSKESLTTVVYGNEMSLGLDPGYDVGQFSAGPDVEIYTSLVEKDNGVNFARQALPVTAADKIKIPVGIDSEKGGEVTFSAVTVPLGTYKFWLEDRTTGIFTDISTKSCTVTLPAKTYGTGRFFIYASTNTPTGIEGPLSEGTDIRIWTSNEKVIIKGEVSDRSICEVYDLRGQRILETRLSDGDLNIITLPAGSKGVFLVRIVDGIRVTTGKVAIL